MVHKKLWIKIWVRCFWPTWYMYTALYKRKWNFSKSVNFGSVALAFHYGICFNAGLSRYSHWKKSEIYHFNRFATQNFLRRPTMLANIFEDSEPPSKKFLATPLYDLNNLYLLKPSIKVIKKTKKREKYIDYFSMVGSNLWNTICTMSNICVYRTYIQ